MPTAALLVYDDAQGQWGPITDLRPVFALRTGTLTTLQRIERVLDTPVTALTVPDALAAVTRDEFTDTSVNAPLGQGGWLLVNGRWLGVDDADQVKALPPGTALVDADNQIIAAYLTHDLAAAFVSQGLSRLPEGITVRRAEGQALISMPWHILDNLDATLRADLNATTLPIFAPTSGGGADAACFGQFPVHLSPEACLQPRVVFNTELGPIVIEKGALIGAMSVLEGPCYIGPQSQVSCHAHIRPHTVVGPVCKVAGEISHTVMQGYANKGHHGYLGHSLIGQWVNLGAATNVSNLKNTYGQVRVQLEADTQAQPTGRMYQGPIIGDYTRTAIGTRLMTGSCIGTGSMVAVPKYAPKFIDRFTFLTEAGPQRCEIDKLLGVAQRMMTRRDKSLSSALEARLRHLAQVAVASRAA